jgi:hypothetical protein
MANKHGVGIKNPIDFLLGHALAKFGFDMLAEYFARLSHDDPAIKPWMPAPLARDAFLIDCHSHTSFSDGEGTFESVLHRIGKGNIVDGILFSNHVWSLGSDGKTRIPNEKVLHQTYDAMDVIARLKQKHVLPEHFISFPGTAEFVARGTERFPKSGIELIGTGLSRSFIEDRGGLARLRKLPAEDIVDAIHEDGGIAILVHPFYFQNSSSPRLWRMVDAIEMVNQTTHVFVESRIRDFVNRYPGDVPLVREAFNLQGLFGYFAWRARVELESSPRPEVGASDAHVECFAGAGCTMMKEPVQNLEEFRDALRRGKTRGILNPRWEAQADVESIIDAIWRHWGKKIVKTMFSLNTERRGVIPILKIASYLLGQAKGRVISKADS